MKYIQGVKIQHRRISGGDSFFKNRTDSHCERNKTEKFNIRQCFSDEFLTQSVSSKWISSQNLSGKHYISFESNQVEMSIHESHPVKVSLGKLKSLSENQDVYRG